MSSSFCLTLMMLAMTQSSETTQIVKSLKEALREKAKSFPYSVEYELAMPAQPRIAGATEKRRFMADKPDSLYSETTRDVFRSRILIKEGKFYWEYYDQVEGSLFFLGSIKLDHHSPETWLRDHAFAHNSYLDLDEDLVSFVGEILDASRLVDRGQQGDSKTFKLQSRLGELTVIGAPHEFRLTRHVAGQKSGKTETMFRYSFRRGKPDWSPDPRESLLDQIAKAPSERVHALTGDINMASIFHKLFGHLREVRTLNVETAKQLAQRYDYALPSNTSTIRNASTYQRGLYLEIKSGDKIYKILQGPVQFGSRAKDVAAIRPFTTNTRKIKDYTVLELKDPGTKAMSLCYVNDDVMLTITEPVRFDDAELDRLMGTFARMRKASISPMTGPNGKP